MRYAIIITCFCLTSCINQPEPEKIDLAHPRQEAMASLVDYAQQTAGMPQKDVYNLVANIRMKLDQDNPPFCPHAGSHQGRDSYHDRYSYHYQNRNRSPEPFEAEGYRLEDAIADVSLNGDYAKARMAYEKHLDKHVDDYKIMDEIDLRNREKNYQESIRQATELMRIRHEVLDLEAIREARAQIDAKTRTAGKK